MEGVQGKMRRKCMRRAAGHTALRGKRKQEGNFQNVAEKNLSLIRQLNLPFWVWIPALEEITRGKPPSPDIKCCLYPCVAEPQTFPPSGGGTVNG